MAGAGSIVGRRRQAWADPTRLQTRAATKLGPTPKRSGKRSVRQRIPLEVQLRSSQILGVGRQGRSGEVDPRGRLEPTPVDALSSDRGIFSIRRVRR
jgi:hypothetical protein